MNNCRHHTKMYIVLSCILVAVSCTFTEPKLQADGITIDLIHRYSPKSPFYNSSMALYERSRQLAHRSTSRYRHLNTDVNTRLVQNNGDYLVKVSIGVPPVDVFLAVDTGSGLIWVQCQPCSLCYAQKAPLFDPRKSSTFRTVPCPSPSCLGIPETRCNYLTGQCQYRYAYGDGSTLTSGIMARDVFGFDNSSLIFGCGYAQQGDDFDENEAGIIGLSGGPLSLISQFGSAINYTFSYCLTSIASNFTGTLRLGPRVKQGAKQVTVPLLSTYFPEFYAVTLKAISFGQRRVEVERGIVIDNGSTLTYVDPGVYTILEEAVKDALLPAMPMDKPPDPDFNLCYEIALGIKVPDNIVIHLSEGDIVLNSTNFMIASGDFECLGIVPLEKNDDYMMILGNVAQVNFEIEFNLNAKTVSFTPSNCETRDTSSDT